MAKKEPTRGSQNRAGSRNVTPEDRANATKKLPTDDCNYWENEGKARAEVRQEELRKRGE